MDPVSCFIGSPVSKTPTGAPRRDVLHPFRLDVRADPGCPTGSMVAPAPHHPGCADSQGPTEAGFGASRLPAPTAGDSGGLGRSRAAGRQRHPQARGPARRSRTQQVRTATAGQRARARRSRLSDGDTCLQRKCRNPISFRTNRRQRLLEAEAAILRLLADNPGAWHIVTAKDSDARVPQFSDVGLQYKVVELANTRHDAFEQLRIDLTPESPPNDPLRTPDPSDSRDGSGVQLR